MQQWRQVSEDGTQTEEYEVDQGEAEQRILGPAQAVSSENRKNINRT
jgi:hypothetical protein